jgi:DNA end-binding protein Ku
VPRSIWSGAISFGLVNIPVKLVSAVDRKNVRFRDLRREDASRVRYRKVAAADGEEVSSDEMVKGFEIAPDRYVVLEPEELKALAPESSRAIEIEDFVELAEIEPIHYDSSYYLVPGDTAAKPYALLHTAMRESGKAAVARFVLRTKQHLAVIRPSATRSRSRRSSTTTRWCRPRRSTGCPATTSSPPTASSRWPTSSSSR